MRFWIYDVKFKWRDCFYLWRSKIRFYRIFILFRLGYFYVFGFYLVIILALETVFVIDLIGLLEIVNFCMID